MTSHAWGHPRRFMDLQIFRAKIAAQFLRNYRRNRLRPVYTLKIGGFRMKHALRWLAIVVALLVLIALALPFLIDANQFRPRLEAALTQALAREVKLGDLKLSIFSGGVAAADLSIADDPAFSKTPFIRAKSLKVGVEMQPLIFSKKLNVTGIEIEGPEIDLIQS